MKVLKIRKEMSECDGGCDAGAAPFTPVDGLPGMGPVVIPGGPDRFDNVIGYGKSPKRKKVVKRKRK